MELLVESGHIEWQGNLKSTYEKYLHPDVLDYDTEEMWAMVEKGEILNLFQFTTDLGRSMAMKTGARNIVELASANSLMRITTANEEQPIDRYVRFKGNIEDWYNEMEEWGLNEKEVEVANRLLKREYGQISTQEDMMSILRDGEVSGYEIKEADSARKAMSKKDKKKIEKIIDEFFEAGRKLGTREVFLQYLWKTQIEPQLGYAFSINHVIAYTLIALQELNLGYHYPRIYWDTSCLIVDSGSHEESIGKAKDYGKVAKAIATMQGHGVVVDRPSINEAKASFIPNEKDNSILFGFKGIAGVNDEVANEIIKNRPYKSLDDFVERNVYTKSIIKKSHVIQLIKAGAFTELTKIEPYELMRQFLMQQADLKESINMQNMSSIIKMNIPIDKKYSSMVDLYIRRTNIMGLKPKEIIYNHNPDVKKKIDDKLYLVKDKDDYYKRLFSNDTILEEKINGDVLISMANFDKEYNKIISPLRDYIASDKELLYQFNRALFAQEWLKYATGTISKWEMDSLGYYYHEHELKPLDNKQYNIVNFNDLPKEPEIVRWNNSKNGRYPIFKIERIAGTILDKLAIKHSVTILDDEGNVVNLKFHRGSFAHYNKRIKLPLLDEEGNNTGKNYIAEESWFKRGNKIMVTGFRREDQFIVKKYADSVFRHTVTLIEKIDKEGNINTKSERLYV